MYSHRDGERFSSHVCVDDEDIVVLQESVCLDSNSTRLVRIVTLAGLMFPPSLARILFALAMELRVSASQSQKPALPHFLLDSCEARAVNIDMVD